jgi:hypothetical protein
MGKAGWPPAYWMGPDYDKHWPVYTAQWSDVLESTKDGSRKYHPSLSRSDIQKLEMSYRKQQRKLRHPKENQVAHWIVTYAGEVVGASNGKETNKVLVKRSHNGPVHGHPINDEELNSYENRYGYYEEHEL